uniref:Uncharacterized protein n=1 Tax=Pyrodinium bahamense TaxID=73915 RepID=A0A7S0AUE0_9DINO
MAGSGDGIRRWFEAGWPASRNSASTAEGASSDTEDPTASLISSCDWPAAACGTAQQAAASPGRQGAACAAVKCGAGLGLALALCLTVALAAGSVHGLRRSAGSPSPGLRDLEDTMAWPAGDSAAAGDEAVPSEAQQAPAQELESEVSRVGEPRDSCDESAWPDKDHGLVCSDCKVLVDNFSMRYKTCSGYCLSVGRECTGAWEELGDTCKVAYQTTCDSRIPSSDAICSCGHYGGEDPGAGAALFLGSAGEASQCDEDTWPDKDHGLVCSDCKVLVNYFDERYGTCEAYCSSMGRRCTGAWEEEGDTCNELYTMRCNQTVHSSDALCECSPESVPTTTFKAAGLRLGDHIEVRDSAVSGWLEAIVTSVDPLRAMPDGWGTGYRWDSVRMPEARRSLSSFFSVDSVSAKPPPSCLCIFDMDRTLTCKQRWAKNCPGTKEVPGAYDTAYGGGPLVLSDLAHHLGETFCSACYRGVVSAGMASGQGSEMRSSVLDMLGGINWTLSDTWSHPAPHVTSMLVVGAPDKKKQDTVRDMVRWLQEHKGVTIEDRRVHFFDDNDFNVPPFEDVGFNARQISCGSRDGKVGLCGGLAREVVEELGVQSCAAEA